MRAVIALLILLGLTVSAEARDVRPRAWCGWFMRHEVPADPGPAYNLARNWSRYGAAIAGPVVGAIVVWPHHVGMITGRTVNGLWMVHSGNDGHAVRTRARSLSGAIAFRLPQTAPSISTFATAPQIVSRENYT